MKNAKGKKIQGVIEKECPDGEFKLRRGRRQKCAMHKVMDDGSMILDDDQMDEALQEQRARNEEETCQGVAIAAPDIQRKVEEYLAMQQDKSAAAETMGDGSSDKTSS